MARAITATNQPKSDAAKCFPCFDKDNQLRRHVHFLQFGDENALGGHLREQYGEYGEKSGQVSAIISWVLSMRQTYSGKVDGNADPLPTWKCWLMAHGMTTEQINQLRI